MDNQNLADIISGQEVRLYFVEKHWNTTLLNYFLNNYSIPFKIIHTTEEIRNYDLITIFRTQLLIIFVDFPSI